MYIYIYIYIKVSPHVIITVAHATYALTCSIMASMGWPPILSTSCLGFSTSHLTSLTWSDKGSSEWMPFFEALAASCASVNSGTLQLSRILARPSATSLTATFSAFSGSVLPTKIWPNFFPDGIVCVTVHKTDWPMRSFRRNSRDSQDQGSSFWPAFWGDGLLAILKGSSSAKAKVSCGGGPLRGCPRMTTVPPSWTWFSNWK